MLSYSIFTMACLAAFVKRVRFLLMPVLFFIVYGAMDNAISHTWWSVSTGRYFPGLISAQPYWMLGPMMLGKLLPGRRAVAAVSIAWAVTLAALLAAFGAPLLGSPMRA